MYQSIDELTARFERAGSNAGLVIVGSFVPEGLARGRMGDIVAKGITAFYDIDTPITLARLAAGERDYISPGLIAPL